MAGEKNGRDFATPRQRAAFRQARGRGKGEGSQRSSLARLHAGGRLAFSACLTFEPRSRHLRPYPPALGETGKYRVPLPPFHIQGGVELAWKARLAPFRREEGNDSQAEAHRRRAAGHRGGGGWRISGEGHGLIETRRQMCRRRQGIVEETGGGGRLSGQGRRRAAGVRARKETPNRGGRKKRLCRSIRGCPAGKERRGGPLWPASP